MHDPLVVAFEIRRPWPRREKHPLTRHTGRWEIQGAFWTLAGLHLYWPSLITVWHVEPRGHDSGTVCPHFRRYRDEDAEWQTKVLHGWRWHVHHWRIQVHPLQELRRRLLTRCAWCGGRSTKANPVNVSHQWNGPRGKWWQGAPGLYHHGCSSIEYAHRLCLCDDPGLSSGDYGQCAFCGKFRGWRKVPDAADRLLAAVAPGTPMTSELRAQVEPLWAARRAAAGNPGGET